MPFPKLSYLNILRDEPVYPPFADIEELVLSHEQSERSLFVIAQPAVEAVLVALLALAVLWKPAPNGNLNGTLSSVSFPSPIAANNVAANENSLLFHRPNRGLPTISETNSSQEVNKHSDPKTDSSSSTVRSPAHTRESIPASNTASVAGQSPPSPVMTASDEETVNRTKWEGFIAGALLVPPSGILSSAIFKPFNATAGLRYALNSRSSLVLEVRKNSFISNTNRNLTSLTAISISLDGQSFRNVIGTDSTISSYAPESVASLDVGYHYAPFPNISLSPFAEILTGGSLSGVLASESIGAEYAISSLFFDLDLRADQLFSIGNSPRRAFTLEAGAGIAW